MSVAINKDNFNEIVLQSEQPVLIDFWAEWCGPCRVQLPIVDSLSEDYEGKAIVAKINVDENPELAQQFRITSIPTIVLISNGELVDRVSGVQTKQTLANKLDAILEAEMV